jgi:DNA helicase II / ATP-dependent DNA helicase PcrA
MSEFEKRYKLLNEQQKMVVDSIEGPVLVVAGPGSGKTETLGLRVANILIKTDTYPSNILCLTFTDSASVNMKKRLKDLIGTDAYKVSVNTFHSFARDIRNYHPEIFYEEEIIEPADEFVQLDILESIFKKMSHDNPLSKTHPEWGYIYINKAKKSIEHLKKAGITAEEFSEILDYNQKTLEFLNPIINELFRERISKELIDKIPEKVKEIKNCNQGDFPVEHMKPLHPIVVRSLERAFNKAKETGRTSPLTKWQNEWTYKTEEGERALKESKYLERMKALADVYKKYGEEMYKRGYYDFDDMILDVIQAIEENKELKYELQEQYQYILIDEFQDTNDAQMRLVNLLTEADVNEGRPNIMAVGDDDQAIFKFQGAEISNILKFKDHYRNPEIITLTKSYRSRQDILDLARHVIIQGEERLENIVEEVNKILKAENKNIREGEIISESFRSEPHQYYWIAKEIKRLIEEKTEPQEIAIIGREHEHLKSIVPYLAKFNIPISYERKRDVLKEPHIQQLIQVSRFIVSLLDSSIEDQDHLMPEILSYPFWKIDRKIIWDLSRQSFEKRKPWIECMKDCNDEYIREIADFFLEMASFAKYEPLERVLDRIVGAEMHIIPDSEDSDIEEERKREKEKFIIPFKDYYFSKEKFQKNPVDYLNFLSSLRTFVQALRDYKKGESIGLKELINFVKIHSKNNKSLSDESVFVNSNNAVNLLTAHSSKGLEFDTIFVLNCQDEVWANNRKGSGLPFPNNLPISPAGDNRDDQLRLFYVAITRTSRQLYLTSYQYDDRGKEKIRLQFITSSSNENHESKEKLNAFLGIKNHLKEELEEEEIIVSSWKSYHHPPFKGDEKAFLEKILENYKLSVTHFNNFLNVAEGGPQIFLEQNLLRFPQPKTVSLSFGTAMHNSVNQIYKHLKKKNALPDIDQVLKWFEEFLKNERLNKDDFKKYLERGKKDLKVFYKERKDSFKDSHFSEFNFRNENIAIDEAFLSGKIDKIVLDEKKKQAEVWDFKTGNHLEKWDKGNEYEKIKSWKYKNQLIFYKILVEKSKKFGGIYRVDKGVLEFLEPKNKKEIISLPLAIEEEEVERLKELIVSVYKKIIKFNLPVVEDYEKNIKGIKMFEEDLLKGKV